MDNLKLIAFALFFFASFPGHAAGSAWVTNWYDGPAQATFERSATAQTIYTDMPFADRHAASVLPTQATRPGVGTYFGPASTATTPQVSASLKIPLAAAGASVAATMTAVIPKAALAKAAVALVRANPYVSAAMTFGWLGYAGYQYFADSDTFQAPPPATSSSCPSPLSVGSSAYNTSTHTYFIGCQVVSSKWNCPATISGSAWVGVCTSYSCGSNLCGTGQYNNVSSPPVTTLTPDKAATGLANAPVTSSGDTAAGFDGVLGETASNGFLPQTDGNPPQLSGSTAPIQGEASTTTAPDGTVTTTSTTTTPTFNNNSVSLTDTTTTTTTNNNNVSTTTTTTAPSDSPPQADTKTDCDKYPDDIGCAKFGAVPAPETIPTTVVPVSLSPSSWGSGSCPLPINLTLFTTTNKTLSLQPVCDFMTGVYPVVIAIGWLMAGFIVMSGIKD